MIGEMERLVGERETVSPILTAAFGELELVSGRTGAGSRVETYGWKILPLPRPVILSGGGFADSVRIFVLFGVLE